MSRMLLLKKDVFPISVLFIFVSFAIYALEFLVPRIIESLISSIKSFDIYMSFGFAILLCLVRVMAGLGNSISIAIVKKSCNEIIRGSNRSLITELSFANHIFGSELDSKANIHQSIIDRLDSFKYLLLGLLTLTGKSLHLLILLLVVFLIDVTVGIVVLVSIAIAFILFFKLYKNNKPLENMLVKYRSKYLSQIFEGVRLFEVIRSIGAQKFFYTGANKKLNDLIRIDNLRIRSDFLATFLDAILSNFVILVSLCAISVLSALGTIDIADSVTIFFLTNTASSLTSSLFSIYINAQRSKVRFQSSKFSFDDPHSSKNFTTVASKETRNFGARRLENVILRNVLFQYQNKNSGAISTGVVEFKRGNNVAIVGPSGGGKSTLGKLVAGLLEPTAGTVEYTYSSNDEYIDSSLPPEVVFVPQAPLLLSGTLRDNLVLDRTDLDDKSICRVLEQLSLFPKDIITSDFLQLDVSNAKFSGGELQRLNIARAALRPSDIVVLDEPSSALDLLSEILINDFIKSNFSNRLVITIAHRMASVERCNKLVVVGSDLDFDFYSKRLPSLKGKASLVAGFN